MRDAGGLDPAYALAVEAGQIAGPRILPSGSFLSITGGHGDHRSPLVGRCCTPSIPGLVAHTEIVDGVDAVRRAARTQIRRGATQVKLMASGGVMSPTDPIESLQFTVEEMAAAVHEAKAFGKYVMAHCHTSGAMNNALDAGVRSIEHGSILDEQTARKMADAGRLPGADARDHRAAVARCRSCRSSAARSWRWCTARWRRASRWRRRRACTSAPARTCLGRGSDVAAGELVEKAKHLGAMGAIVSATKTNAALFRLEDRIGTLSRRQGRRSDPRRSAIRWRTSPSWRMRANIPLVVKAGVVVKDAL